MNHYEISSCEKEFKFSAVSKITENIERVAEIGKVSVLDSHQCRGYLKSIVTLIGQYAENNDMIYYIVLIDATLARVLEKRYNIRIEYLGEKTILQRAQCRAYSH